MIDRVGREIIRQRRAAAELGASSLTATPADIVAAAEQTNLFIDGLNTSVAAAKKIPQPWRDSFAGFYAQWKAFFPNVDSFAHVVLTRITTADFTNKLVDRVNGFQQQALAFAAQAKKFKVLVPGEAAPPAARASNVFMWIGISVAAIVGLIVVAKIAHTAVTGNLGGASMSQALRQAERDAVRVAKRRRRGRN